MYKGLYNSNEAIARFSKGDGIFFKKECIVKIHETKIFRMMKLVHLKYLKQFLFNPNNQSWDLYDIKYDKKIIKI